MLETVAEWQAWPSCAQMQRSCSRCSLVGSIVLHALSGRAHSSEAADGGREMGAMRCRRASAGCRRDRGLLRLRPRWVGAHGCAASGGLPACAFLLAFGGLRGLTNITIHPKSTPLRCSWCAARLCPESHHPLLYMCLLVDGHEQLAARDAAKRLACARVLSCFGHTLTYGSPPVAINERRNSAYHAVLRGRGLQG